MIDPAIANELISRASSFSHATQENERKYREMQFKDKNPVVGAYESIVAAVSTFQDTLDNDHEIGVQLASFNQNATMHVTHISYSVPALINFYGYVNGNKAHLIQHISQLNFLITALPKLEPDKPARRIGFDTAQ